MNIDLHCIVSKASEKYKQTIDAAPLGKISADAHVQGRTQGGLGPGRSATKKVWERNDIKNGHFETASNSFQSKT